MCVKMESFVFCYTSSGVIRSMHVNKTTECVYLYIRDHITEHGYGPSLRQAADHCYIGTSTLMRHLDKLEALGLLAREPGTARGLTLLKYVDSVLTLQNDDQR